MQQPTILIIDDGAGTSTAILAELANRAHGAGVTYRVVSTTTTAPPFCASYEYALEAIPDIRPKVVHRRWRKRQDAHRFHRPKWRVGG